MYSNFQVKICSRIFEIRDLFKVNRNKSITNTKKKIIEQFQWDHPINICDVFQMIFLFLLWLVNFKIIAYIYHNFTRRTYKWHIIICDSIPSKFFSNIKRRNFSKTLNKWMIIINWQHMTQEYKFLKRTIKKRGLLSYIQCNLYNSCEPHKLRVS